MISDKGEETGTSRDDGGPLMLVLPSIAGLFALFISAVLLALTLAPAVESVYTTVEVYTFIVRLTALWAGLVWLSSSIYISLITGSREFSTEIWLAFLVGALMSYLGVSGEFIDIPYWLGVRAIMYTLISLIAVTLISNIQKRLGTNRPAITLLEMGRRVKRQLKRR